MLTLNAHILCLLDAYTVIGTLYFEILFLPSFATLRNKPSLLPAPVRRYLEFQGLKFTRVLTSEGLISVPLTKSCLVKLVMPWGGVHGVSET